MTDVCFSKTEVVISQPWIALSRQNAVGSWTLTFSRQRSHAIRNRKYNGAAAAAVLNIDMTL